MAESQNLTDSRIALEGCSVLLDVNDGDRLVFARLSASATLKIGNKSLSLRPLIGCPFGSLFQVETGPKGPVLSRVSAGAEESDVKAKDDSQLKDINKDNRALVDNNSAQSLSSEDIDVMRREGASGDQIIEALIANSSTFENKTAFSQEKYRVRKQKKYAPRVLLRRPYARSICEAYFKKHPARIGYLRVDALSLLLSMANVSAYSDVLVVDMIGGIITGSVAERLGGTGYVCNACFGPTPYPMDIVRIFNFSNEICSRILQTSFSDLSSSEKKILDAFKLNVSTSSACQTNNERVTTSIQRASCGDPISKAETVEESDNCLATEDSCVSVNDGPVPMELIPCSSRQKEGAQISEADSLPTNVVSKSVKAGRPAPSEILQMWKENGFTSLIIAAPELDTWNIVQELLPLISYSASFAIYHQYLQPLAVCMHKLQSSKLAIGLQISEPWLREYQVLPSRTHPFMQMSAFGGYILSGTRICSDESCL